MSGPEQALYERVGGMPFFERLVDRFYAGVVADPELWALYPDHDDLDGARRRLTLFLAQYWGGPTTYSEERGHPMLRRRHHPYLIDAAARDRWLAAMRTAVDESGCGPEEADELWAYLTMAAEAMRNRD